MVVTRPEGTVHVCLPVVLLTERALVGDKEGVGSCGVTLHGCRGWVTMHGGGCICGAAGNIFMYTHNEHVLYAFLSCLSFQSHIDQFHQYRSCIIYIL